MNPRRLHSDTILSMVTTSFGIGARVWQLSSRPLMPIYEYRCENGHLFEVMQKIADPPVTACETCEAPVQRVFHPIAVHFKGSGFYNTDYGTSKRKRELDASAKSGADKHDAKSKEKKDSAPSSSSSSSSTPSGGTAD
jgi:putative FmdB family regulatory protein